MVVPPLKLPDLPPARTLTGTGKDIFAIFQYKDPSVRSIIWAVKYRGNPIAIDRCAHALYDVLTDTLADETLWNNFQTPLIIPIPLSKKRARERGFNQALLLAKALVKIDGGNQFTLAQNILYKNKETRAQSRTKNKQERLRNLRDCFSVCNKEAIFHKNIIIIDDVTTTGSTFREARRTLLAAGAKRVICFAIAH